MKRNVNHMQAKRQATMHAKGVRDFEAALQRLLDKKPKNRALQEMLHETGRLEITQTNVALEAERDRSNLSDKYREVARKIRALNSGLMGKTGVGLSERYREANMQIRALRQYNAKLETYIAALEVTLSKTEEKVLHEQQRNRRQDGANIEPFPK